MWTINSADQEFLKLLSTGLVLFINLLCRSNYGARVTDKLHMNKNTCSAVATLYLTKKKRKL